MKTNRTAFILLAFAGCLFISACKKKNDQPADVQCLFSHIYFYDAYYNRTDTFNFSYDPQKRLDSFYRPYVNYVYSYNGLTGRADFVFGDSLYADKEVFFNSDGNINRMEADRQVGSTRWQLRADFIYNEAQQVTWSQKTLFNLSGGSNQYYKDSIVYSNGNPVEILWYYKPSGTTYVLNKRTVITYSAAVNKIGSYVWGLYYPLLSTSPLINNWMEHFALVGKGPVNLPATVINYDGSGAILSERTLSFTADENGYVTEANDVWSTASVNNYRFQYDCE